MADVIPCSCFFFLSELCCISFRIYFYVKDQSALIRQYLLHCFSIISLPHFKTKTINQSQTVSISFMSKQFFKWTHFKIRHAHLPLSRLVSFFNSLDFTHLIAYCWKVKDNDTTFWIIVTPTEAFSLASSLSKLQYNTKKKRRLILKWGQLEIVIVSPSVPYFKPWW